MWQSHGVKTPCDIIDYAIHLHYLHERYFPRLFSR